MSWTAVQADWSDAEMVPAIRYPSTRVSTDTSVDYVFATIETFNISKSTPGNIIDSLNNHNMGNVELPAKYTFDMSLMPVGKAYDLANKCQNGRRYFDIVMMPANAFDSSIDPSANVGTPENVWNHVRAVLKGCKIRDNAERYSVGGKPLVTFSCTALRYVFDQGEDGGIELGNGYRGVSASESDLRLDNIQA